MTLSRFFRPSGLLALALLLAGCATLTAPKPPPKSPPPVPEPARKQSYWQAEAATGAPSILLDLTTQRAHFFFGKTEVGQSLISSGKRGYETATGEFTVIQLDKNHASNLYGEFVDRGGDVVQRNVDTSKQKPPAGASFRGAKMPFFLRFNGGIGMHAGKLPGYPASHGCVRMPRAMAEHFFNHAPLGTPVTVKGHAPTRAIDAEPARPKKSRPTPDQPTEKPAENPPPTPIPAEEKKADPAPPTPAPVPVPDGA